MTFRILTSAWVCWIAFVSSQSFGQTEVKLPPREQFHLFLLVGQSNMAGRGAVEEPDKVPNPNVLMLTKENEWAYATDPMHFDKPAVVGVGLGRTFGIEVAEAHHGITVGLIPCAHGGSPISAWEPGQDYAPTNGHPYDDAIKRAKAAMKSGTLKGILWHQGESDANPEAAPLYEDKLHKLIARFRKDLDRPDVPFIAGQLGQFEGIPWNEFKKQVDAALRALPHRVSDSAFVESKGLTHKGDKVHFDAKSYRELGARYAEAYLKLRADAGRRLPKKVAADSYPIGSVRELFALQDLIDEIQGDAKLHVHEPTPGEVVFVTDRPWEGNTSAYYTIFQDGDIYRMYYRGSHFDEKTKKAAHREVTCYAESKDGIHWTRPNLGLFDWEGSKDNNILLDGLGTHCFVAFRDDNPKCPPEARYKGISRGTPGGKHGLYVFQSPDGIHWKLIKNEPVITQGAFDSQNLAFWHPGQEVYYEYHRVFINKVRAIAMCTSKDFITWTEPEPLLLSPKNPAEHLYTNAIRKYPRAPIFIGFPTRFIPKGEKVEPIFMASRDGLLFERYDTPVIPRTAPKDRDGNRSNYMANALVQLPGNDREYTVYGTEAYYTGPDSRLRRFTYRVDGFVSLRAGSKGGEAVTVPIEFTGDQLYVNAKTTGNGRLRVEIQDKTGKPIEGFSLADCLPFSGDELDHRITWKTGDLNRLEGQPVRLRFVVQDGDVFSYQFRSKE